MPEMTSCRKCGQMITRAASKCPACGALTQKLGRSAGARVIALVAAILLGLIAASLLMGAKVNAESSPLPPHAVPVDRHGTGTCERGYPKRVRACVPEEEAGRGPQTIVSDLPSAGSGASAGRSGLGVVVGASPGEPGAQGPLYIQTSQPWTVILDSRGNPSTVIVGGAPARAEHSALFGR
jgi:hypothetical protein